MSDSDSDEDPTANFFAKAEEKKATIDPKAAAIAKRKAEMAEKEAEKKAAEAAEAKTTADKEAAKQSAAEEAAAKKEKSRAAKKALEAEAAASSKSAAAAPEPEPEEESADESIDSDDPDAMNKRFLRDARRAARAERAAAKKPLASGPSPRSSRARNKSPGTAGGHASKLGSRAGSPGASKLGSRAGSPGARGSRAGSPGAKGSRAGSPGAKDTGSTAQPRSVSKKGKKSEYATTGECEERLAVLNTELCALQRESLELKKKHGEKSRQFEAVKKGADNAEEEMAEVTKAMKRLKIEEAKQAAAKKKVEPPSPKGSAPSIGETSMHANPLSGLAFGGEGSDSD